MSSNFPVWKKPTGLENKHFQEMNKKKGKQSVRMSQSAWRCDLTAGSEANMLLWAAVCVSACVRATKLACEEQTESEDRAETLEGKNNEKKDKNKDKIYIFL